MKKGRLAHSLNCICFSETVNTAKTSELPIFQSSENLSMTKASSSGTVAIQRNSTKDNVEDNVTENEDDTASKHQDSISFEEEQLTDYKVDNENESITKISIESRLLNILFRETTTFGVRIKRNIERAALHRNFVTTQTVPGCESDVKVKVGMLAEGGEVITLSAEYEDCKRVANETDTPIRQVASSAVGKAKNILQNNK